MSDILEQEEDDYNDFDDSDQEQFHKSIIFMMSTIPLSNLRKILLCNCILQQRTLLDEMDYQCMKIQLKIYKEPATCQMNLYPLNHVCPTSLWYSFMFMDTLHEMHETAFLFRFASFVKHFTFTNKLFLFVGKVM